jgi:GT2 family glycosyltransferase
VSLLFKNNPITREFLYLNLKDQKKAVEVEGIVGAFFAVKKKVFNEIGGFDRNFFLFAEDIDLCLRILR